MSEFKDVSGVKASLPICRKILKEVEGMADCDVIMVTIATVLASHIVCHTDTKEEAKYNADELHRIIAGVIESAYIDIKSAGNPTLQQ